MRFTQDTNNHVMLFMHLGVQLVNFDQK